MHIFTIVPNRKPQRPTLQIPAQGLTQGQDMRKGPQSGNITPLKYLVAVPFVVWTGSAPVTQPVALGNTAVNPDFRSF